MTGCSFQQRLSQDPHPVSDQKICQGGIVVTPIRDSDVADCSHCRLHLFLMRTRLNSVETILFIPRYNIWSPMLTIHEPKTADLQFWISVKPRVAKLDAHEHELLIGFFQEFQIVFRAPILVSAIYTSHW